MTVCLHKAFYLLSFEILSKVMHQLAKDFHVHWNWMQTDDNASIVLDINLGVPFMSANIIYFNSCRWICI